MKPFENAPEVALPDPAGLEVEPGSAPILSRDDEKMMESERFGQTAYRRRTYCGLGAKVIWILAIVLVLVVIAVAVGAGVGVSKHSASSTGPIPSSTGLISSSTGPISSPPAETATTNVPLSTPPTPTTSGGLASATAATGGCQNGTTYISSNNTPFIEFCNTDFGVGETYNNTAADWDSVSNIATFASCMDICAIYRSNDITSDVDGTCLSVTWVSGASDFGGCFMKNTTAMVANGNSTAQMMHALPHDAIGLQSANIVGDF
ncbi:hypothetical protein MMC17_007106 [Xylographa soralifera]|nr:hypothetical protein [Xylographa soralifera]